MFLRNDLSKSMDIAVELAENMCHRWEFGYGGHYWGHLGEVDKRVKGRLWHSLVSLGFERLLLLHKTMGRRGVLWYNRSTHELMTLEVCSECGEKPVLMTDGRRIYVDTTCKFPYGLVGGRQN